MTGIADAAGADVLLVPADGALYAVHTAQDGVTVTPRTSLDLTRPLATVTFDAARRASSPRTPTRRYGAACGPVPRCWHRNSSGSPNGA